MIIHHSIPFALAPEKNFGAAINDAVSRIGEDDWMIISDYDFMFLLPEHRADLYEYAKLDPMGLYTCVVNRVGQLAQCLNGVMSENADVRPWIERAKRQRNIGIKVREFNGVISGCMMMFSKKLWNDVSHFQEDKMVLGVDNGFAGRVMNKGYKIYIMESIIGFHVYRIGRPKGDKSHLK